MTLLLSSTLASSSSFGPSFTRQQTWTVDVHGQADFDTIQEAINNATEGDTILVSAGTYYEHIVVNKTLSLLGEDVNTTIIDGNQTGRAIDIVSNNVNVTGFTVQRSGSISTPDPDAGICLSSVADCTIWKNRLVGNGFAGISLIYSQRNTITGNNVSGTGWGGIHLMGSSNNIVSGNILDSNIYVGINGHASSHYNNIKENVISNSRYGMFYHDASHNTLSRNNISNISVEGIWLQDLVSYNTVAENNLTNCNVGIRLLGPNYNNILSGNILTNGQCGIRIENAEYAEICENTIAHNYGGDWDAGIRLDYAGYCKIHSNLIVDNGRGILLYTSSPQVSIYNNNITDNDFGLRVACGGSSYANISNNIVINNRGYGIGLTGFGGSSDYAVISRNLIANNSDGIALGQDSYYNTIVQNNISQNGYGFYIEYSALNAIWGNNIVRNDQQVYVSSGSVNSWDNSYPSGGNCWSGYNGTDSFMGLYQNESGSDGIGDTPYMIDMNNVDRYPLLRIMPCDLNHDFVVDILDSIALAEVFGTVPTSPNWNPNADTNGDNVVNILDAIIIGIHFLQHYP